MDHRRRKRRKPHKRSYAESEKSGRGDEKPKVSDNDSDKEIDEEIQKMLQGDLAKTDGDLDSISPAFLPSD